MKLITTLNKKIANVKPEVYGLVEKWVLREAYHINKDTLEKNLETLRKNAVQDEEGHPQYTVEEQAQHDQWDSEKAEFCKAITQLDSELKDFHPTDFDRRLLKLCAWANLDDSDPDNATRLSFGKSSYNRNESLIGFATLLHDFEWLKHIRAVEGENSKKYKDGRIVCAKVLMTFFNDNFNVRDNEPNKSVCFNPQKIGVHLSKPRIVEKMLDWLPKNVDVYDNSTAKASVDTKRFWKSMAGFIYTKLTNITITDDVEKMTLKTNEKMDVIQDDEIDV